MGDVLPTRTRSIVFRLLAIRVLQGPDANYHTNVCFDQGPMLTLVNQHRGIAQHGRTTNRATEDQEPGCSTNTSPGAGRRVPTVWLLVISCEAYIEARLRTGRRPGPDFGHCKLITSHSTHRASPAAVSCLFVSCLFIAITSPNHHSSPVQKLVADFASSFFRHHIHTIQCVQAPCSRCYFSPLCASSLRRGRRARSQ